MQVPCIERCAFGAVKAWTAFLIASNETKRDIASTRHDNQDVGRTGRDMYSEYKETSEAGLAQNLVLC